ncbi:MAG TPA: hypothetical protein VGC54_07350 [Planctomycetota bacterium]
MATTSSPRRTVSILAVLGLAAGACGGSGQEPSGADSSSASVKRSWMEPSGAAPRQPAAAGPATLHPADAGARALVAALAADLAALGFELDLSRVRIESGDRAAGAADLDRQQDLFFPPSYFEGIHPVFRAFGAVSTPDSARMRAEMLQGLAASFLAYYQWDRDALVFFDDAQVPGADPTFLVAHELAHAWRDQVHGFESLFGGRPRTLENVRIVQCLVEGEAQLVAQARQARQDGVEVADLEAADVDGDLARLLAGEHVSMVYTYGQRLLLERLRAGGWPAVQQAFAELPASTEQILHAEKRGRDEPTAVTLPAWPEAAGAAQLVHEDVGGEMALYAFLLVTGTAREAAWFAACGWDGDKLAVYRLQNGDAAFLWRTVWDRPEDAQQFADTLAFKGLDGAVRRGRAVDWVQVVPVRGRPQPGPLAEILDRAMAATAFDAPVVAADAASTAALEEDRRGRAVLAPRLAAGDWVHPLHGLRIPAPAGWTAQERGGMPLLARASELTAFANNFNVVGAPTFGKDLDALEAENRRQFAALPGIELEWMKREQVGEHEVLRYQFHGSVPGAPEDLQFHGMIFLQQGVQVVVTASILRREWAALRQVVLASFDGIRIEVPPAF